MTTFVDIYLKFPADEFYGKQFDELAKHFGSVEAIEQAFEVEFSCGDGMFVNDFWKWSDQMESLCATVSDEVMEKYDGNVCLISPPRFHETQKLFKTNKDYRFTVKYSEIKEEESYYLNSRLISTKWVG